MDINFKIYNIEIIDCSSCSNSIFPDPESKEILLEFLLRICESNVVAAIGKFQFYLNDVELQSPNVYGVYDFDSHTKDNTRYKLAIGKDAQYNKIAGLMVEIKEDALKRITEPTSAGKYGIHKCETSHYIEPGLEGIKKGIKYIKSLYNDQKEDLPNYLKNISLRHFGFSVGIIWGIDAEMMRSENGTFEWIDYERCGLGGGCDSTGCNFHFSNFMSEGYEIYASEEYLNHLNKITEIIDEIAQGKYIAGPEEYYDMLNAGILKREGRKLVLPIKGNVKKLLHDFEWNRAFSIKVPMKERVQKLIKLQKSIPIENLARALKKTKEETENIIYELVGEGINGILENDVFIYEASEEEITMALFKIIDKI